MDLELRPQLPLLAVRYATFECFIRTRRKKTTHNPSCLLFAGCSTSPFVCVEPCDTMAVWGRSPLLVLISLWMSLVEAGPLAEPQICYVLDGILFLYGIILTALYCRIKIYNSREAEAEKAKTKQNEESIYTGLTPHAQDTYETIGMKK